MSGHTPWKDLVHKKDLKWIESFHRAGFSDEQILNPEYLFSVFNGEGFMCKACGTTIVLESRYRHLNRHRRELEAYRVQKQKEKTQEYYDHPCDSCGGPINKTGKPGRPPTKCERCRE